MVIVLSELFYLYFFIITNLFFILVFTSLNVFRIDSLVLACKLEPSAVLSGLQDMWTVIEELAEQDKFGDVGVSDIDTDVFITLYNWAKVR